MSKLFDRIKETANNPTTGNVTLLGAVSQFRSFGSVYTVGDDQVPYAIADQSGTKWEVGLGTYFATNTLRRDLVLSSSNSGALESFTGAVDVWVNFSADQGHDLGRMTAMSRGYAMP